MTAAMAIAGARPDGLPRPWGAIPRPGYRDALYARPRSGSKPEPTHGNWRGLDPPPPPRRCVSIAPSLTQHRARRSQPFCSAALGLALLLTALAGNVGAQTIATVAGTEAAGYNGDGIAAPSAQLNTPAGVAVDSSGNVFFADALNHRIRKVAAGIITTVAGTGTAGFNGDNQAATSAQLNYPTGVALDASGNLFICEYFNHRIRRVIGAGMGTRPLILAPADQARIGLGESLALQWTEVAGAIAYGVEYTGPGLQFTNTNGMLPDRTNGFGGAGGVLFVYNIFTSMGVNPVATPGSYQFRVIGLKGDGTAAGTYSDAITVVVQ